MSDNVSDWLKRGDILSPNKGMIRAELVWWIGKLKKILGLPDR